MNKFEKRLMAGMMLIAIIALAGCGGSGSGDTGDTGDTGNNGTGTGFLSLGVSDGPVHDATKVCIEFQEIEIKGEGPSELVVLPDPVRVNLLDFQGNNAAPVLTGHELPAGDYEWLRLGIDAVRGGNGGQGDSGQGDACEVAGSYIVMKDQTVHNLYVPSSANNGLKLVGGITVPANSSVNLTAEFDLMKSITAPPGLSPDVKMRPTIRLVDNNEVGTLTGQVANELATAVLEGDIACDPSVYVFNDGVTPNGIETDENGDPILDEEDPIATAMVAEQQQGDGSVEYHYTVGFLLAGDYEAAFTCDGTTFEPVDGKPAPIVANEITVVNFEAPATN